MILLNFLLALIVALVAYRGGIDPWYCGLIWWAAYRTETALGNQMAICHYLKQLVGAELMKVRGAQAMYEQSVAEVASNN